jgi:hypothetical protein
LLILVTVERRFFSQKTFCTALVEEKLGFPIWAMAGSTDAKAATIGSRICGISFMI